MGTIYGTRNVISRYVAQVFSEWFWDGSSCSYYYWYHFCCLHPTYAVFSTVRLLSWLHYYYYYLEKPKKDEKKERKGQPEKERMFKQKCGYISLDIRLQNLNIPMFIISSRNSTFRQRNYTCIQSVYTSWQLDTLRSNFSNYLYSFRMHYLTRNIETTTPLDSHYHITQSQVQALIYYFYLHRHYTNIYKLKRHVYMQVAGTRCERTVTPSSIHVPNSIELDLPSKVYSLG